MSNQFLSVFHPTDLTPDSFVAFTHAVAIAAGTGAALTVMHVNQVEKRASWEQFPSIRDTVARWEERGLDEARRQAFHVRKVSAPSGDTADALVNYLDAHPSDIVVMATHQYAGLRGIGKKPVAVPVLRHSREITLLLPAHSPGIVSSVDGSATLRTVLIPIAPLPRSRPAFLAVESLLAALGVESCNVVALHVGNETLELPEDLPINTPVRFERVTTGNTVSAILDYSREVAADLIVMPTEGRKGWFEGLTGSTTEQVAKRTSVPLLAVPSW